MSSYTEDECITGLHGTPEYSAPEVIIWYWHECVPPQLAEPPPPYGIMADLWSLGMCLHVMLCGCFPFETDCAEEEMLRAINLADFSFGDPGWAKLSQEALCLVRSLLQRDPRDRPVLEEVLQQTWCAETVNEAVRLSQSGTLSITGSLTHTILPIRHTPVFPIYHLRLTGSLSHTPILPICHTPFFLSITSISSCRLQTWSRPSPPSTRIERRGFRGYGF